MPLTLVEILTKYWPMGRQAVLCKMIGTLQATSIFVSTISITAISLDRYQVNDLKLQLQYTLNFVHSRFGKNWILVTFCSFEILNQKLRKVRKMLQKLSFLANQTILSFIGP